MRPEEGGERRGSRHARGGRVRVAVGRRAPGQQGAAEVADPERPLGPDVRQQLLGGVRGQGGGVAQVGGGHRGRRLRVAEGGRGSGRRGSHLRVPGRAGRAHQGGGARGGRDRVHVAGVPAKVGGRHGDVRAVVTLGVTNLKKNHKALR